MNYINISNLKTEGLTPLDFYRNPKIKKFDLVVRSLSISSTVVTPFFLLVGNEL
jgi:hypothetical protein